jgi:hypothetical protein
VRTNQPRQGLDTVEWRVCEIGLFDLKRCCCGDANVRMLVSVAIFIAGPPGSDEREVYATRSSPDPKHSEVLIICIFVAGSPRSPASRLLQRVLVQTTLLVAAANFVGAGLLAKAVCMRQGYRLTRCILRCRSFASLSLGRPVRQQAGSYSGYLFRPPCSWPPQIL